MTLSIEEAAIPTHPEVSPLASEPFDPYAPPVAITGEARTPERRRRWLEAGLRAAGVILGFSLVADPTALPGVTTALGQAIGGHVLARGIGMTLLATAFLPWRRARQSESPAVPGDSPPEVEDL